MNTRIGIVEAPGLVRLSRREVTELQPHQVLIRIRSSCICGSDLHIYRGRHPAVPLPVTVGHEFAGEVEAVGDAVNRVKPGDRVTVEPSVTCGKCDACLHGDYGYCEEINFTYRMGDGAMADLFVGRWDRVHPLPEGLSFDEGSLAEPVAVALHAVRRGDVRLGDTVAVIGAGAIGILVAAICRRIGAADVIVSDRSASRLALVAELGATCTVDASSGDLERTVFARTGGRGADKSFECVGAGATYNQAVGCLRRNGLATVVGIYEQPRFEADAAVLVARELRIQGAQGYCWDFPDALRLIPEIGAKRLITHHFPLDELAQAFAALTDPGSGAVKVCLHP